MDKQTVLNAVIKANCALEFERKIVGVKFLFTEKEFNDSDARQLETKMSYCKMVLEAMSGDIIKADFTNFACFGGARSLGIVQLDEFYSSGRFFRRCGLYQDLTTSKKVTSQITACNHRAYGIEVRPLEEFNDEPDVVLMVTNPLNTMRIIQGYTYKFGTHSNHRFIGNQAICSECTAQPYEKNDINVSVLCSGPRTVGFLPHEMGIGMPFNKFIDVIDGLCATITPVEYNTRKKQIEDKFKENGITDVDIVYDKHYNHGFFKRDFPYFEAQKQDLAPNEEDIE